MPDTKGSGKVSVEIGITYNLGNYESLRVSVILDRQASGEPGDTQDEVFNEIRTDVRAKLYEALADEISAYRDLRSALPA